MSITEDQTFKFTSKARVIWYHDIIDIEDIISCNDCTFDLCVVVLNMVDIHNQFVNINDYQQLNINHIIFSSSPKQYEWKLNNFSFNAGDETINFRSNPFNIDGFDFIL